MMTKSVNKRIVQCTLVGDGMVGKTSVITKFLKQDTQDVYTATVFDNFAGDLSVAGDKYTISVYDTAGQQDYEGLRVFTYSESDVILVCFSLVDRQSFENVREFWIPEIRSHVNNKKPIILVATQTDAARKLKDNVDIVTKEERQALAEEIGAREHVECSSSDENSVGIVFEKVVNAAIKYKKRKLSIIHKILGK